MKSTRMFKLSNYIGHAASVVLILCFFASLIFTVLPKFPEYPSGSEVWAWFIAAWNLPGPLMFVMVFRIHALRVVKGSILRKKDVLGITLWVKFWFVIAVAFGLITMPFLFRACAESGAVMPWYLSTGTAAIIIAWFALLFSTAYLIRLRCSKDMLPEVERAGRMEHLLLAPSSIVFLFFTGLSSIGILLM
ncbi:MAG: hypothetical protein DRN83_02305 [Hadesarchaea archaeon]|nr:MAG: hypothetical protein DRN83_02305 [Hadesarchaea archaeon]HDI13108.1 hypothetical protein [Hadesarchaea archaeon]